MALLSAMSVRSICTDARDTGCTSVRDVGWANVRVSLHVNANEENCEGANSSSA
jgi:hypothetical protein